MLRYRLEKEVQAAVNTMTEYNCKYFIYFICGQSDFIPYPTANQKGNIVWIDSELD